jgi:putative ABC transport system ATP-binding protein
MHIELHGVTRRFRSRDVETTALNALSLAIPSGRLTTVIGPSGCGKTTMLAIMGLLDAPDEGEVRFDGECVSRLSARRRLALRREKVSFIFQSLNLIEEISVTENVALPARYMSLPARECRERAEQALEDLGLGFRAGHFPFQLSGGQRQRVAIARALAMRSNVILADEPTGNLDRESSAGVLEALLACRARGTTVILVTHDPDIAELGDFVVEMQGGHVTLERAGELGERRAAPSERWVRAIGT